MSSAASRAAAAPHESRHLGYLYEIGRALLPRIVTLDRRVSEVLAIAVRALPLRTAVLIEGRDSRVRSFVWRGAGEQRARLGELERNAAASYARFTDHAVRDIERHEVLLPGAAPPGPAVEPLSLPLTVRGQPSFGVLQLEPAHALDEEDLAFLDIFAAHISLALDRYHGRRREVLLRRQAEEAEKEVRRVNENLERLVSERTRRLELSVKDLQAFSYSIAHDLRAPLRHIHGYSELLLKDAGPESQRSAQRVMAAVRRMDKLIDDLLLYSRLSLEDLSAKPVDASAALARAVEGLQEEICSRRATVDVVTPLPRVMGDPVALGRIFDNLLSNALKFTRPGEPPLIRVGADLREGWARLWVEDRGIGVEPAHREKIFGVFQRLHAGDEYPGTGIGLAIVRRAAERMGGRAGVDPAGSGSRFWIELRVEEVRT